MAKVYFDVTEWYPVYILSLDESYEDRLSIIISEEDFREHQRIEKEFNAHQLWLEKLYKKQRVSLTTPNNAI